MALGTEFQNWPYLHLLCLSQSSVLQGQIKMRKASSPPLSLLKTDIMLPAVVKLCCGISYPHLRNMAGEQSRSMERGLFFRNPLFSVHFSCFYLFHHAGLQRAAVAVIGQEITHLQGWGWIQHPTRAPAEIRYNGWGKKNLFSSLHW